MLDYSSLGNGDRPRLLVCVFILDLLLQRDQLLESILRDLLVLKHLVWNTEELLKALLDLQDGAMVLTERGVSAKVEAQLSSPIDEFFDQVTVLAIFNAVELCGPLYAQLVLPFKLTPGLEAERVRQECGLLRFLG